MSAWRDLVGSPAVEAIAAQIERGEIAGAWLLLGPHGAGKRAAATAMAAALNCRVEPLRGCGRCSACLRIARGRFPDVHHVEAEGTFILVDTVREVLAEASRSPFEGAYKVFVIDEAERMNPQAQNALLKTLEEPHPDSVFVLISAREEEVLDTIRSRCRIVRLEPVSEERVVRLLTGEGASPEAALMAARLSEGDVRRARALAFDDDVRERRRLWLSMPRRLTSAVDALDIANEIAAEAKDAAKSLESEHKREITELAEILGERRGTAAARNALMKRHKREARRAEEDVLAEALVTLAGFYRDALALRTGGGEGIANLDAVEELRSWAAASVSDGALLGAVDRLIAARGALARNANVALTLEAALLDLVALVPAESRVGAPSP